ncbi:MAG: hypothetical protein Q9160_004015 [Pyrenula sp. 1 TL-2023]
MPASSIKYRHLGRDSAHRQALLRNLVTSLFEHESITTTWPKAKEAQRLAEKLVTYGKRNTNSARSKAQAIFYNHALLPKLFGPLRDRYADRPGGYTRVLRVEPKKTDQAESAILELVDGPRDIRFAMTARTLVKQRQDGMESLNEMTAVNVRKVTRFREGGEEALMREVERQGKRKYGEPAWRVAEQDFDL